MDIELIPAIKFTIDELTDLYNQTRVDYLVPMPMSANILGEYVHDFDVDLDHSYVARAAEDGQVLGLGMLGLRKGRSWVTRLGVLPSIRRGGTGGAIMDAMLGDSDRMGLPLSILEVIKNNTPAHTLFRKCGFVETGEYLVLRRAPRPLKETPPGEANWLDSTGALVLMDSYPEHLTWINEPASMYNATSLQGLTISLPSGGYGWMVYRYHKFRLSHFVLHTQRGDPHEVGRALLAHLHFKFPRQDAYAENVPEHDPHCPAFADLGYFEVFRRVEMIRKRPDPRS
ncbi:MAG TPA: GNAT family N-acetyltransferase [Anaerolineales bacterium]|nr:GNAT family N-acetyltransferase [Anaerolineales bacterium]